MNTETPTRLTQRLALALAIIGGSVAIAYGIGRSMRELPAESAARWQQGSSSSAAGYSGPDATGSHPAASSTATSASPEEREKKMARIKLRLCELWECTPNIFADWEAERETQALIEELDPAELAAFLRETKTNGNRMQNFYVRTRVAEALVAKDGPAAIEESMTYLADSLGPVRTFAAWVKQDPEEALTWLRDAKLSPELEEMRFSMRQNALSDLAQKDFTLAAAELPYLDAGEKRWLLNSLGAAAKDEAKSALLKELIATHDPGAALAIEKSKVMSLAGKDPAAALEHIASLDMPAEQKEELEIAQLHGASSKSVTEAYDAWLSRRADTDPIPDGMWPLLDRNFIFYHDDTMKWLDTMPAGATRDAFYRRSVRLLASRHDFEKAAAYAATIGSVEERQLTLQMLGTMWTEANPGAAKAWQQGLPESDRQHLK